MGLLSYIFPQVRLQTSSAFNHDIKVIEMNGKNGLYVNGIQQTGPYDESIFISAFQSFNVTKRHSIRSILLLGLGGGFVAKKLHQYYPQATITCVDIDPVIVSIAKEYFDLSSIPNISYEVFDAKTFIKQTKHQYDLVVIDLYIGDEIPDFVESADFISSLTRIIRKPGGVLINYQAHQRYADRSHQLAQQLRKNFALVHDTYIRRNRFFFAEK